MTPCFTLINTDNCNLGDYQSLSLFFKKKKATSNEKDATSLTEQAERGEEGGKSSCLNANILTNCN